MIGRSVTSCTNYNPAKNDAMEPLVDDLKNDAEIPTNYHLKTILLNREIPLDLLLKNAIGYQDDTQESMPPDRSALQKKARREFNETLKSKPTDEGFVRYQVKLSQLPDELYPIKVDGKKIIDSAIQRFHSLEKRLDHPRNKSLRDGVHARLQALIQDKMLIKIGEWYD